MRRIKFLGLAAVVLVAAVGVLAASANAETGPTWFECGKAAKNAEKKYTGKYNDKACTQKNEAGEGKYELQPGVGKAKASKGKGGTTKFELETPDGHFAITCGSVATEGTPKAPNLETAISFVLKKCAFIENSCKTPGAKKGEIKGSGLVGELGYVEPESGHSAPAVGLKIVNPDGEKTAMATFECGEGEKKGFVTESSLEGAVIGVQEGDINTLSKESTLTYVPLEQFGEHEFTGKKYKPLVNIIGFADEVEEIQRCSGLECTEEHPAHVIRGVYCGEFIEGAIHETCTPPTYTGLAAEVKNKGEALMIKAETGGGDS